MSNLRQLIRREVDQQRELIGKVVSVKRRLKYDQTTDGAPVWVVDVDIGGNRPVRDVPIKAGTDLGSRSYADLGQTVRLKRNIQGRYDIIGPGDRLTNETVVTEYDIVTDTQTAQTSVGFTFERLPFEFYANIANPGMSFWNDGNTPFPKVRIIDPQGNEVT